MELNIRELRSFVNRGRFMDSNIIVIEQAEWSKHNHVCVEKLPVVIIADKRSNKTFKIEGLKRMISENGGWHPRADEMNVYAIR